MKSILFLLVFVSYSLLGSGQYQLKSPDGSCVVSLNLKQQLSYSVNYNDTEVISASKLGFRFRNQPDMGKQIMLVSKEEALIADQWKPVWGKRAIINEQYNSLILVLKEINYPKRDFKLELRAYNEGIAFRYFLPVHNGIDNSIRQEYTEFNFSSDHDAWIADFGGYVSHQEEEFKSKKLSSVKGDDRVGTPMLIKINEKCFATLLEANIDNYPGLYFGENEHLEKGLGLVARLSTQRGKTEKDDLAVLTESQYTPWRVIMLGQNPGSFIESNLIVNLNDPCEIEDPSWIKPGLCAWDHWWSGEVKMDTETIKEYIDLASKMGWPYMLIDWQWYGPFDQPDSDITTVNPKVNMPEVLAYAKEKEVRCWLWLYWTDASRMYEKAFPLYEKWGIAGVKIDFMTMDDQEMVNWYEKVIKKAAEHRLMVNFHGAYRPDGIRRTYPNMMTREGVLGNEYNKWSSRITPEHNTTLPFTRMLAGPMDYTPGGFLNRTPEDFKIGVPANVMTTRAQQLAMFIVYESPIITVCDHPDHYYGQKGLDFLIGIPANWDETKFIDGYPGKYVAIAKKSGNDWYLGIINNSIEKEIEIDLGFLGPGKYNAKIYADGDKASTNPVDIKIYQKEYKATDKSKIKMVRGGGIAIKFSKK